MDKQPLNLDGCFWVIESDKDGYIKIIKYRIAEVL